MIVLLYMWQKKALNIYRSFCGISFSTKTFKKFLLLMHLNIKPLNYITKMFLCAFT